MVNIILIILCVYLLIEVLLHLFLKKLKQRFKNAIITGEDKLPGISKKGLAKFMKIGYDPELGWVRKPNTSKTEKSLSGISTYTINSIGSRTNPGHEKLPIKISTFGDSYTFGRHINDNETWQFYLARLLHCNVTNFGVGNYGLDQAFLRFKKELPKIKGSIVIMGIVPETIRRNLSVWKHYNEFGNTFGFKPRFKIDKGELKLVPNIINQESKFFEIRRYLKQINKEDYFYKEKFKKYLFTFPYVFSILQNPRIKIPLLFSYGGAYLLEAFGIKWKELRFIPKERFKRAISFDLQDKITYYNKKDLLELTLKILKEFSKLAKKKGLTPMFIILPEYDDLEYIKRTGDVYYKRLLDSTCKFMPVIDLSKELAKVSNIESIYSNKEYGGHYNTRGNKIVARAISNFLSDQGIFSRS